VVNLFFVKLPEMTLLRVNIKISILVRASLGIIESIISDIIFNDFLSLMCDQNLRRLKKN
jgi:hypothetical protein